MRISDWSSDVCSSDLLVLADHAARIAAVGAGLGAEIQGMRGHAQRQPGGVDDIVEHDVGQRDFRGREEWKSVVSGKSVSVRVDIGGRCISKNKTYKQYIYGAYTSRNESLYASPVHQTTN